MTRLYLWRTGEALESGTRQATLESVFDTTAARLIGPVASFRIQTRSRATITGLLCTRDGCYYEWSICGYPYKLPTARQNEEEVQP